MIARRRSFRAAAATIFLATLWARAAGAQASSSAGCWTVDEDSSWVEALFAESPDDFSAVVANAQAYRVQVLVGEIERDEGAFSCVRYHPYRLDAEYFYPASAIKTFAAAAAIAEFERFAENMGGVGYDTPLWFESGGDVPLEVPGDEPDTLRSLVREALLVSSNPALNRLYDIAGHEALNRRAWDAGFGSLRFAHRLERPNETPEQHRSVPAVHGWSGSWLRLADERESTLQFVASSQPDMLVGASHIARATGRLVSEPMDFSELNYVSLWDLLGFVGWVVDPGLAPGRGYSGFSSEGRALLLDSMSTVPESVERFKPMSPGVAEAVPRANIRYVNKAGRAYGFHVEVAYIENVDLAKAFLVATVIYANPDGVVNDDLYAYSEISYPYMASLGRALAARLLVAE